MKLKFINILIFLFSIQFYCQNNYYVNWENPNNFLKYKLENVSIYNYEVKRNGKLKKDSLLLRKYEYNKAKSIIKGINHSWVFVSHGGGSHYSFYYFKNQFINDTILIKSTTQNFVEKKSKKEGVDILRNINEFKYDSLNRIKSKTIFTETDGFFIYKRDTILTSKYISSPKTIEFEYDSKNRVVREFIKIDSSTSYFRFDETDDFSITKSCNDCHQKQLNKEFKYDEKSNNLKQKKSNIEINHNDNGKIITTTHKRDDLFPRFHYKNIDYYNKEDLLIKHEDYSDNQIDIHEYIYENSKLIFALSQYGKGDVIKFEYLYNKNGLIKEIKHFIDNKMVGLERYYYE